MIEREKEYRSNDGLNYSSIKIFVENGPYEFYRRFIAKEKIIRTDSDAVELGSIVDCLLTSEETFDQRFEVAKTSPLTGQSLELVNELFALTKVYYNYDTDTISIPFKELFIMAFDRVQKDKYSGEHVKFKGKTWEDTLTKFEGGPMQEWYDELFRNIHKKTVMYSQYTHAKAIKEKMMSVPAIFDIYHNPLAVHQHQLYFEFDGIKVKGMTDTIHIDRDKMVIQEYELKTSWSVSDFSYNRIKNKYYLQEALYHLGLGSLYPDFKILPRKYVVVDSTNQLRPYIASTTKQHLYEAMNGFVGNNGATYRGLLPILEDIRWHFNKSIWDTTREIYENNDEIVLV